MRILVVAVGRMKQGPERELADRYRSRFEDTARKLGFRTIEIHELVESRAQTAVMRMAEEAAAIAGLIPEKSVMVALDEHGKSTDSPTFAGLLGRWRDDGITAVTFVIGGADGLSPDLTRKAKLRLAFGASTWPHQLARIMLLEQIYRASTILSGHPYHRA
jgi:23S rRNA (pseudouridine1915-N3)-methyltransferase